MNGNTIYSIGCGDYPDETMGGGYSEDIMALTYDDENCVQCLGSLVVAEYRSACLTPFRRVNFRLPVLVDVDQVWIGFASQVLQLMATVQRL
jgi:hypothetical protein